ncbi:flagellar protein FlaG [Ruminiclostridium cellobioparum]|uniref:flagellar protein FlaG n=1 Tax=Ruminiclostridium cellobioparum TaxID=29355 RepID=UPI0028A6FC85|nr:flagellar protein FlaG [Ruminiclostridium cellobioparum]
MKIDSSEPIRSNINLNNNTNNSSVADKKASANDLSKDWSSTKPISQLKEYDKDNMPVSERVVIEAIQKANKAILGGNRRFEFSIHEQTNEIVVKVYNSETDELIREIPNEKILDMVAKICEMAGLFVDERR